MEAKDMLLEFEKTYMEKGLNELISSSQLGLLSMHPDFLEQHAQNSRHIGFELEADEKLNSNQLLISPFPNA